MISVGNDTARDNLCLPSNNVITFVITANQLVGAYEGQQIKLECHSEAFPKSINYWMKEKGDIVPQGGKVQLYSHDQLHMCEPPCVPG